MSIHPINCTYSIKQSRLSLARKQTLKSCKQISRNIRSLHLRFTSFILKRKKFVEISREETVLEVFAETP